MFFQDTATTESYTYLHTLSLHDSLPILNVNIVPTLRGTIVALGGTRVADMSELPKDAWFLRGERGVTYSDTLPEGPALVEGEWWPKSYEGPPLISLDREAAKVMNVGIGDTLVVSVLGREKIGRAHV